MSETRKKGEILKRHQLSTVLTLNVKVIGEEGEHGGAANVDGAVKHVTYYLHLFDKTKCREQ